ncbi:protein translocase subunit SecF [Candidatus Nitrosacidococcus sp. I8]|uniref:protein translocase subunit SecF n=1 Tax=Candidatus Nitrosacidococcus sp. I8 TaxID=2942908 RepID=UPI002226F427|nr:protein translocase subunit SecF [Candidatus Nitrosacidococcus sp. I8]CAH9019747.1 Protein translocase subunit SecF [Candidatus Nitrosacidococcus sp. I8]
MEIFKNKTQFDFMGKRRIALSLSTAINVLSVIFLIFYGLNFGLDYTGGILIEVGYDQPADLSEVRSALAKEGYEDVLVQHFGTTREVMIRLAPQKGENNGEKVGNEILQALNQGNNYSIDLRRVEFVGPEVGEELATDGWVAMFYAAVGILIYVTFRFEYRFAVGAIVALVHDVLVILGVFSLFKLEFDLTVLAAVLAVIGYSLNDTVIIADRIRENFHKLRKATTIEVLNRAINDTLSRTIMTSALTLMVLVVFYFLGGKALHNFSLALIIGIVVGTYSSIYIASPIALYLGVNKSHFQAERRDPNQGNIV